MVKLENGREIAYNQYTFNAVTMTDLESKCTLVYLQV